MIAPPNPEFQIQFLQRVQRILAEGTFVSTYKFALLHALADLAVLKGEEGGGELRLATYEIAEQFVELYWRQTIPFPSENIELLSQNTGRPALVVQEVRKAHDIHGTLAALKNSPDWNKLVKKVERTVKNQPLWKLQTVGSNTIDFLYPNQGSGISITLFPGIAHCLRAFHSLIINLARGSWIRYIRQRNAQLLGEITDVAEFLFGSERENLYKHQDILIDIQEGACFYCEKGLRGSGEVDHFIPWSNYPIDLGHNFVLAHQSCNRQKSNRLAALPHLKHWYVRNDDYGVHLSSEFDQAGILHNLDATQKIATWAYGQIDTKKGFVWSHNNILVPLENDWRAFLASSLG